MKVKSGLWKDQILLKEIASYYEITAPKSSLRLEALRAAGALSDDGAWVEPALDLLTQGLKCPEGASERGQYQIPLPSDEDEEMVQRVAKAIRGALGLSRVQVALVFRLALAHRLLELRKKAAGITQTAEAIGRGGGLDAFAFWAYYREECRSNKLQMEALKKAARKKLERDESLYVKLRGEATKQLRALSDAYGPEKLEARSKNYGTVDIRFVSSVLAGLYGVLAEVSSVPVAEIIEMLEAEENNS